MDRIPAWLVLLAALVLLGTGCSGINSSHGVSPATFLLPGFFGEASPAEPAAESAQTIAHAN